MFLDCHARIDLACAQAYGKLGAAPAMPATVEPGFATVMALGWGGGGEYGCRGDNIRGKYVCACAALGRSSHAHVYANPGTRRTSVFSIFTRGKSSNA